MKKLTAFICLLCTLCLLTGALAAPGDAYLFTDDQKDELGIDSYSSPSMAVIGDTVYTLWGTDVFAWQSGEDTPEQVASNLIYGYYSTYDDAVSELGDDAEKNIDLMVGDGEMIYGLNDLNGYLYPLTFADGLAEYGTPVMLDWTQINDIRGDSNYVDLFQLCIVGGSLYLLVRDGNNYDNPLLIAFDLTTGEAETFDINSIQDMAPYRDGKLFLEIYDYETAYNSETGEIANPTLAIFDPADGSVTEAGTFSSNNVYGIAYDADSDTVYYTTNSMLMAMPALGEPVQVAYMPVDYAGESPACVLSGGLYVIDTWSGVIVRNTDPSYMPSTTLSIYGGYIDNAGTAFMAQYPDVPLTFNDDTYFSTSSALAQAMVSGDSSFDIYYFDLSYQDFEVLMKKGYCLDLSPYTDITDQLSAMYPFIQTAISEDGVFYAVPSSMYSDGLSIFQTTWEDLGITDRIPTSFIGLLEFIQWWADEGIDEYPDIQLMEYAYDYHTSLFYMALNLYVQQYQAEDMDLTFDTPLFREILSALEAIDFETLNDTIPEDEEDYYDMSYEDMISSCLFSDYGDWLTAYAYDNDFTPLILPLEEGGTAHIPADLSCVFVNPNTENPELAVAYLRCILDEMYDVQHIMMFPDDNEPIVNSYFEETIAYYEDALAEAQESLETAAPEDVKDIQSSIDNYEDFLSRKDSYYWDASAESIAAYREQAELAFVETPDVLSYSGNDDAYTEISTLINRYMDQQLSMEQFITQLEQKIRMIQLEGE